MAAFSGSSARRIGMWGFGQAQDAKNEGANLLNAAQNNSLAGLGQGYAQAVPQYQGAIDRLNPYTMVGTQALPALQGSYGIGGDAARDAAVSTFREGPGYQYRVDKGTDAVARKASALGALGSGNTMTAIADYNRNEADQGYSAWQAGVQGMADRGQAAAGTQAQLQAGLGNLYAQQGRDQSSVYGTYAGLGQQNLWNATNLGVGAVNQAAQRATDNVNSGYSFGANMAGAGLSLLGLGTGGGNTLGGNLLKFGG